MSKLPKQADLKWETAAMKRRLEIIRDLKQKLQEENSIESKTVELYSSIIDGE